MEEKLSKYIQHRINALQKHNFNPDFGANQIKNRPNLAQQYGSFKELVDIVLKFNLDVDLVADGKAVHAKQTFVYFAKILNRNTWKIGFSINPYRRVEDLQVGNADTLEVQHVLLGGRELESKFKSFFRKYKTRNKNLTKGEWFALTHAMVNDAIRNYKLHGDMALAKPLKRNR